MSVQDRDRLLQVIGFVSLLAASTFWFLSFIQPLELVVATRVVSEERFQLLYEQGDSYIPAYRFNFPNRRLAPRTDIALLSFDIGNESTSDLQLKFHSETNQIEIWSLGLQGLLLRTEWSGDRIANEFHVHGGELAGMRDGAAVFNTRQNAILSAPPEFADELRALKQWEGAGIAALFVFGLFAFTFPFWWRLGKPQAKILVSLKSKFAKPGGKRAVLLMIVLLGCGSARLLFPVLQEPMVGISNNGDFFRLQACVGWQSTAPTNAVGVEILTEPVQTYKMGLTPVKEVCYLSSQLLFIAAAQAGSSWPSVTEGGGGRLDLRLVGVVSALALIGAGIVLTLLFARVSNAAGLVSAGVFALLMSDPMYGFFFNTLYSEIGGIVFGYIVLGLMVRSVLIARLGFTSALILALGLYLLALAKLQTMLLPLGLAIVFVVVLVRLGALKWRKATAVALLCIGGALLLGFAVQRYQQDRSGFMRANHYVNLFNTYFGTLLPSMSDPAGGANILNLPGECRRYVGLTWYDTPRDTLPCRDELFEITIPQTLMLFTVDPTVLPRLVLTAIPLARPWLYQSDIGIPPEMFDAPSLTPYWTIAWFIDPLPIQLYWAMFVIFALGSLIAAGIVLLPFSLPPGLIKLAGIQLLLATVVAYSFLAALFGDGFFDFARHTYLIRIPLLLSLGFAGIMIVLLTVGLLQGFGRTALADSNVS